PRSTTRSSSSSAAACPRAAISTGSGLLLPPLHDGPPPPPRLPPVEIPLEIGRPHAADRRSDGDDLLDRAFRPALLLRQPVAVAAVQAQGPVGAVGNGPPGVR